MQIGDGPRVRRGTREGAEKATKAATNGAREEAEAPSMGPQQQASRRPPVDDPKDVAEVAREQSSTPTGRAKLTDITLRVDGAEDWPGGSR